MGMAILVPALISAAVSAASYTLQYFLTPKPKPIEKGKLTGDVQVQNSRYGDMIPLLLGGSPSALAGTPTVDVDWTDFSGTTETGYRGGIRTNNASAFNQWATSTANKLEEDGDYFEFVTETYFGTYTVGLHSSVGFSGGFDAEIQLSTILDGPDNPAYRCGSPSAGYTAWTPAFYSGTYPIGLGSWRIYKIVRRTSTIEYYFDGNLVHTQTLSPMPATLYPSFAGGTNENAPGLTYTAICAARTGKANTIMTTGGPYEPVQFTNLINATASDNDVTLNSAFEGLHGADSNASSLQGTPRNNGGIKFKIGSGPTEDGGLFVGLTAGDANLLVNYRFDGNGSPTYEYDLAYGFYFYGNEYWPDVFGSESETGPYVPDVTQFEIKTFTDRIEWFVDGVIVHTKTVIHPLSDVFWFDAAGNGWNYRVLDCQIKPVAASLGLAEKGGMRIAGNVVWMSNVRKREVRSGGGKGGGQPETIEYKYYCDLGIMFGEGRLGLKSLWADSDLMYDGRRSVYTGMLNPLASLPDPIEFIFGTAIQLFIKVFHRDRYSGWVSEDSTGMLSGYLTAGNNAKFRFYSGTETQNPDPIIDVDFAGNATAYRGRSYLVLENFELTKYGRIPNFTALLYNKDINTVEECAEYLAGRVGYTEMSGSSVASQRVKGIVINQRDPVRKNLELLTDVYGFDFIESGGQTVAVTRGGSSSLTITEAELGAVQGQGEEFVEQLQDKLRTDGTDLPKRVDVTFWDIDKDCEVNTAGVSRLHTQSANMETHELNVVLEFNEARQIAQRKLDTIHIEGRRIFQFKLPYTYYAIQPADIVTIELRGRAYDVKILQVNGMVPGVLEFTAAVQRSEGYDQSSIVMDNSATGGLTGTISGNNVVEGGEAALVGIPGYSAFTLIDITLRDREALSGQIGFYVAAARMTDGTWGGANLYVDRGGYEHLTFISEQAIMGWTDGVLAGTRTGTETVDVQLLGSQTLSTYTGEEVAAGSGYILVGDEVLQYTTATQLSISPNLWRLSGLVNRGARATAAAMATHADEDRFVLLDLALQFVSVNPSEVGVTRQYRCPTVGMDIEDVAYIEFTLDGPRLAVATPATRYEPLTNGSTTDPQLVFDSVTGDILMESTNVT